MKKYLQVIVVLTALLFLVWLRNAKLEDEGFVSIKPVQVSLSPSPFSGAAQGSAASDNANNAQPAQTVTPAPQNSMMGQGMGNSKMGQYKNGSFTGSVQDAYYGNVQVQAVISGGKITDVVFLQYPNDNPTSQYINSQAMPLLKQEAIQAQSANVSGVSGASATSPAFIASLTDALSQAKN